MSREPQPVGHARLGATDLEVPQLAFGASPLGKTFRDVSLAEGGMALSAALDLGVNLIDVAPFYGLGLAERRLGELLRDVPRERFLLSTKVGRYGPEIADCDYSAARTRASVEESLRRLRVEHLDLALVHDVEFADLEQVLAEALPALAALKAEGKARYIGVTGLPLALLDRLASAHPIDVVLSYSHYALTDDALAAYLPRFEAGAIGVINASPLVAGHLTQRGAPDWHPAPARFRDACREAAALCRDRGASLERLAVQYATSHDGIPTTLVGTANAENLRDLVRWLLEPLDEELLEDVLAVLAPTHNLTWPQGRPENNFVDPAVVRAELA